MANYIVIIFIKRKIHLRTLFDLVLKVDENFVISFIQNRFKGNYMTRFDCYSNSFDWATCESIQSVYTIEMTHKKLLNLNIYFSKLIITC